jgi:cytochrome c
MAPFSAVTIGENHVIVSEHFRSRHAVSAYLGAVPLFGTVICQRPPPASWATRLCTGPSCGMRWAKIRCHPHLSAEMVRALAATALALAACASASSRSAEAQGDATRGEELYARCAACHALAHDRVGPRHCGLLGRRAGGVATFDYSIAMKKSGIVWDAKTLDHFLFDPMKAVPGTTMPYAGVTDSTERADLIAFLAKAGTDRAHCKPSG